MSFRGLWRFASVVVVAAVTGCGVGCVFAPNIAADGYVACASDKDCDAGRTCAEAVCAPPAWNDDNWGARRVLLVKNNDIAPMPQGTAVPVVVGGPTGVLSLDEVAPDFRVTDFDTKAAAWRVVPVFLDREAERFTAWIPTQREIAQGKTAVLAYLESETAERLPTVVEDAGSAFAFFDAFEGDALAAGWRVHGSPNLANGSVNVADGQAIVLRQGFAPPVNVTVVARLNGVTCDQVFIGLIGDDNALFAVGPAAGVFVAQDLAGTAQVAPDAASVPTNVGDGLTARTGFQRFSIGVDGNGVQIADDDVLAYSESDLRPPFGDAPMFVAVLVHGACSVDVDAVWVTPLPQPPPGVTPGELIHFQLFN